jgi:hypothetical protein
MAPIASIRAIESAVNYETASPPGPRKASSVAQTESIQPETLTNPLPLPKTEFISETEPQIVNRANSPGSSFGWVMPAASVVSAIFGAVAGALIVRSRLSRKPRLKIA